MSKSDVLILDLWRGLKTEVQLRKDSLTSKELYGLVFALSKKISIYNDVKISQLYDLYLSYFDEYDIEFYHFSVLWFSLDDLINFDIIHSNGEDTESIILYCRNILWEILVFKSNRACRYCDDCLRVFERKSDKSVVFSCDNGHHTEDFLGKPILSLNDKIIPVTPDVQKSFFLKPCSP